MILRKRIRLAAGLLLGAGMFTAAPSAMAAPAQGSSTPTGVPSGINPLQLPGVTVFGNTPPDTPESVSFILKENDIQSLAAWVDIGIPDSAYLSVSQFAAEYGQPASNINALTSYLSGYGITTTVDADDLNVGATGTAGDFDNALSVTEESVRVPALGNPGPISPVRSQSVHTSKTEPMLPYDLASFVTAILGLSNYAPFTSDTVRPASQDAPQQGSSNSCIAEFGLSNGCHLPSFFAQTDGLDPLYAQADGAGQTAGIVTLAAVDPGSPEYFWSNVADVNRTGSLTIDNVDGGPGVPSAASGSGESDLDIEQSGAIAPGASVIDYQAPNTDSGLADAFFTAASQDVAGDVSSSWGESETALQASILSGEDASSYPAVLDEAFLELAAQGQSMFIASGDGGAYTASADLGTTNLSVDNPADSPYVTACGGTSLPGTTYLSGPDGTATATTTAGRIWGWDYLWAPIAQVTGDTLADVAESNVAGSGGGYSVSEPEPVYQQLAGGTGIFSAVQYLTPVGGTQVTPDLTEPTGWTFNPAPGVTYWFGNGHRVVPDLAANADPQTGYLIYGTSAGGLAEYGGTGFVAAQMNGAAAVVDSYLGHRTGFWNPVLYRAATIGIGPFTQLRAAGTGNDNIYYTGSPGQPYNEGTGLGEPDLAGLAGLLGA